VRRALGILVAVIWIAAVAVITVPDFFRVERLTPIAQIIAFRGVIVLALAAVAILALFASFARAIRPLAVTILIVAVVGAAAGGATMINRGIGTDSLPAKTDEAIRVMTWNTAGPATSADEIARLAVAMDADIVALPETTIETGEQVAIEMRELGHPMWAHHAKDPSTPWDAGSTTLLITPDLGDTPPVDFLQHLESRLQAGIRLVQLRAKSLGESEYLQLACEAAALCHRYGARLLLNADAAQVVAAGADGVHLSSSALRKCAGRPAGAIHRREICMGKEGEARISRTVVPSIVASARGVPDI